MSRFLEPDQLLRGHTSSTRLPGPFTEPTPPAPKEDAPAETNGSGARANKPNESSTDVGERPATDKPATKKTPAPTQNSQPSKKSSSTRRNAKKSTVSKKAPSPEPTENRPDEAQPVEDPPNAAEADEATAGTAPDTPDQAPEPQQADKPPQTQSHTTPEAGESLDGRPGRLWDTSGGVPLPDGWATIAIERVMMNAQEHQSAWGKANPLLPEPVHQALLQFILQHAIDTGVKVTMSSVIEAAFEQIPDDIDGCKVLLDELPDEYKAPGVIRPKSNRLHNQTITRIGMLPLQLRAAGLNRHAGRVHTAAALRLLKDLGQAVGE